MIYLDSILHLDKDWTLALNAMGSPFWDEFMWIFTNKFTWIPMILALAYLVLTRNYKIALYSLLAILLVVLLSDGISSGIMKPYFKRFRPTHDPIIGPLVRLVHDYKGGRYGFCSSHAANAFGLATFLSLLIRHKGISLAVFAWAFVNTYTRLYLGVHFVGDVVVGATLGTCSALLVYYFYRLFYKKVTGIPYLIDVPTSQETATGYSIKKIHFLLSVLGITILVIAIVSVLLSY